MSLNILEPLSINCLVEADNKGPSQTLVLAIAQLLELPG